MNPRFDREEPEALYERLMRVENALFCLKVKSGCFPCWDNREVERLERLRAELRGRCEEFSQASSTIAI